ncbi:MAG: hypothetical protein P1U56_18765 [Saprospiraceae bacterium]|nr:hypothetical protein [Saprospiraceae bacterium]
MKIIISFVLLLLLFQHGIGQNQDSLQTRFLLGSFHFTSYAGSDENGDYKWSPGLAIEYREIVDELDDKLDLTIGISVESIPLKTTFGKSDFFAETVFNFTVPIGLYYTIPSGFYGGVSASMDIPFLSKNHSRFGLDEYQNTELNFRFLNINISAGVNLGKRIIFDNRFYLIEVHYKSVALFGAKTNDYWLYTEDRGPHYFGLKLGVGI